VIDISADDLRAALDVVLTWGPERSTPEPERLAELRPNLDVNLIQQSLSEAHSVLCSAEELAGGAKAGSGPGVSVLLDRFPWLTEDRAQSAMSQGMYFHWRETGL
jgi:hypothetical protein